MKYLQSFRNRVDNSHRSSLVGVISLVTWLRLSVFYLFLLPSTSHPCSVSLLPPIELSNDEVVFSGIVLGFEDVQTKGAGFEEATALQVEATDVIWNAEDGEQYYVVVASYGPDCIQVALDLTSLKSRFTLDSEIWVIGKLDSKENSKILIASELGGGHVHPVIPGLSTKADKILDRNLFETMCATARRNLLTHDGPTSERARLVEYAEDIYHFRSFDYQRELARIQSIDEPKKIDDILIRLKDHPRVRSVPYFFSKLENRYARTVSSHPGPD